MLSLLVEVHGAYADVSFRDPEWRPCCHGARAERIRVRFQAPIASDVGSSSTRQTRSSTKAAASGERLTLSCWPLGRHHALDRRDDCCMPERRQLKRPGHEEVVAVLRRLTAA
jgi:hypothetical protein